MIVSKNYFLLLIALTIIFPYIPAVIGSLDVQPLLIFSSSFLLLLLLLSSNKIHQELLINKAICITTIFLIIWTVLTFFINNSPDSNFSRFLGTIIFFIYVLIGSLKINFLNRFTSIFFLGIYAVFTIIYFYTDGFIESILIKSRDANQFTSALSSGRGSSALSPEPSFFANQVFMIYLFTKIFFWREVETQQKWLIFFISSSLLILSLSVTGFIYFLIVLFTFLRTSHFFLLCSSSLFLILIFSEKLFLLDIRVIFFLQTAYESLSSGSLTLQDTSFLVRLNSFFAYLDQFMAHPFLGNGFILYGGGGLISLAAELGIIGLFFIFGILTMPFISNLRVSDSIGVFLWLLMNTISGSIANPGLGIFIGMLWRRFLMRG